jgi:hypothetical protein
LRGLHLQKYTINLLEEKKEPKELEIAKMPEITNTKKKRQDIKKKYVTNVPV